MGIVNPIPEAQAQALVNRHYLPGRLPAGYTWHMETSNPVAAYFAIEGEALAFLFCPKDAPDMLVVGYPPAQPVQLSLWG
jgi:hypothetical protein